ncbi:hypothetical protein F5146DRAFT_1176253 [Armillaria mellea]|nr:hypothetical protein F5146DRAFT_1176253 [Armillaria mellea]
MPGNKPVSPCCDFAVDLTDEGVSKPGEPTHANIVMAFFDLSTNPNIQHGNNIIIYFTGHGTTYNCADYLGYKDESAAQLGKIDALCPIDCAASTETPANNVNNINSSVTKDHQVPDISDQEINTILAEIACNKENHITFILDCCFSGSLTKALREGVQCSISLLPSSSIPHMFGIVDETLKHIAGYQLIKDACWRANMDSHIVLAACKEYEEALELEGS